MEENKKKRLLVFDFDGTFFENFFEIDRKIINEVFKNKLVLFVDNVARKVNSLGIVKNTTRVFKLRILTYAILSFKSYFKVKEAYRKMYVKEATNAVLKLQADLDAKYPNKFYHKAFQNERENGSDEKKIGYIIISNNEFSSSIKAEYQILVEHSKLNLLKEIKTKFNDYDICMIGDSILDDIIPAKILGISFIHITKNVSKEKMTFFERKKAIVNSLDHAIKEFLRDD